MSTTIYVLRCRDDTYYVGKTENISQRIEDHYAHRGSVWTKLHPPEEVVEVIPQSDRFDEDKYVLIYMDRYGIDKVRGGSFSQPQLSSDQIHVLKQQLLSANDCCYRCQEKGHLARQCPGPKVIDNYFTAPQRESPHQQIQSSRTPPSSLSIWGGRFLQGLTVLLTVAEKTFRTLQEIEEKQESCYRCGQEGHCANTCPRNQDKCYRCGQEGHWANTCRNKR